MSGVAALFARDGRPADADDVLAMLDAIPYRGPDGAFARDFGRVVLGHARMAVRATERAEIQPLVSPRTGTAIVADVRLDNRDELCALPGAARGVSDADLILRAYERWGLEMPRRLLGDFAFVIWDPREQRLLCARDAAGQRTLFYRANAKTFAAASEVHELLQDPSVPLAPDDAHIRSALLPVNMQRNAQEQARTYYAGISSLLPGHQLVVTRSTLQVDRFARFEPPAPIRYKRAEEYVEHFRELFFTAVAQRLATDTHLGALLSGGLDSTSIVCTAQELYRAGTVADTGFTTFSAVFDDPECDERPLVADVQSKYGFDARYVLPDRYAELAQLEPNGFRDRPEMPTSGTTTLFDAAQSAGIRVLLTGELSDNYLRGGGHVFDSLLRQGKLVDAWRYFRAYRRNTRESLVRTLGLHGVAPMLPLSLEKAFLMRFLERQDRLERWRALPAWMPEGLRNSLLDESLAETLRRESGRVYANHVTHDIDTSRDPPELPTIPSGWSLEIWRPFAARALQEFALAIPPEHLFDPGDGDISGYGASKQLLRRSLRGILPESIRLRTKKAQFSSTFNSRIAEHWTGLTTMFGPGGYSNVAEAGYIDSNAFFQRLDAYRSGERGPDLGYVAFVIGLETWLRNLGTSPLRATRVPSTVVSMPAVLLDVGTDTVSEPALVIHSSGRPDHLVSGRR